MRIERRLETIEDIEATEIVWRETDLVNHLIATMFGIIDTRTGEEFPDRIQLDGEWGKAFDKVRDIAKTPNRQLWMVIGLSESQPGQLFHPIELQLQGDLRGVKSFLDSVPVNDKFGDRWIEEKLRKRFKKGDLENFGDIIFVPTEGLVNRLTAPWRQLNFTAVDLYRLLHKEARIIGLADNHWNHLAMPTRFTNFLALHFSQEAFEKRWIDSKNPEEDIAEHYGLVVYRGKKGKDLVLVHP